MTDLTHLFILREALASVAMSHDEDASTHALHEAGSCWCGERHD